MICDGCAAGADTVEDYRRLAREDDEYRSSVGITPLSPGASRRWMKKRARYAYALHCRGERKGGGLKLGGPGCTCQCLIPELKN